MVLAFLLKFPSLCDTAIVFRVINIVAVHCINCHWMSGSLGLLQISERIFKLALHRHLILSAAYLPGICNECADALSSQMKEGLDWVVRSEVFQSPCQH